MELQGGNCRSADPELFFAISDKGIGKQQIEQAKQICRGCKIIDGCRSWAIEHGETEGVWGGLGPDELKDAVRGSKPAGITTSKVSGETDEIIRLKQQAEEKLVRSLAAAAAVALQNQQ